MPAEATCPHCQLTLRVPSDFAGKSVKCPQCEQRFVVGLSGAAVEAPSAPAPRQKPPPPSGAAPRRSSGEFEELILSVLDEEEPAQDGAEDDLALASTDAPRRTPCWKCPDCEAVWRKQPLSAESLRKSHLKPMVRCEGCGAAFDYQAVHEGAYDTTDLVVVCAACHVHHPAAAAHAGQPCPSCGAPLPD